MAKLMQLVLCAILIGATLGQSLSPEITTVIPPDDDSTTTTTEDSTTTTSSSTTEKTTTSSTTTSTTTTEKTTTSSSSSTTSTTPAPTPAPTPVPAPTQNHWTVKNNTKFCLQVDLAIQLNLTYKTTAGDLKYALYDLPDAKNLSMEGRCTANVSELMVKWGNESGIFGLRFELNETRKQYDMHLEFMLDVAQDQFPDAAPQKIAVKLLSGGPMTPQGMSYHCNRQQVLNATEVVDGDEEQKQVVQILLSKTQWQAFRERDAEGYDLAKDCDAIDTPDIVPIAVGCALAGLVVIVLLGYLVGRRRSLNRGGYLSM